MTIGVPIVTCPPRLYQQCTNNVPIVKNSQKSQKSVKKVKSQSKQQKWPLVYQSSHVYQDCTNSVSIIVKNSEKQSKDSQNSKNEGLRLRGQRTGVKGLSG